MFQNAKYKPQKQHYSVSNTKLVCNTCRKHNSDDSDKSLLHSSVKNSLGKGNNAPLCNINHCIINSKFWISDHNAGKDTLTIYIIFCSN